MRLGSPEAADVGDVWTEDGGVRSSPHLGAIVDPTPVGCSPRSGEIRECSDLKEVCPLNRKPGSAAKRFELPGLGTDDRPGFQITDAGRGYPLSLHAIAGMRL